MDLLITGIKQRNPRPPQLEEAALLAWPDPGYRDLMINREPVVATFDALLTASWNSAALATRTSWPPERRLDGTRLVRLLRGSSYAVLASTRPDGRPHAAPVSYRLAEDASIWLPTAAEAVRLRNVTDQPWVSFVISQGYGEEHFAVLIEGDARCVRPTVANLPDVAATADEWVESWIVLTPQRALAYAAASAPLP